MISLDFLIRLASHLDILKKMGNRCLVLLLFIINNNLVSAQNEVIETLDFERAIENILPQQEFDVDYGDLYDRLFSIYSHPLDINRASRTDFQSLFILSESQIYGIIEYRESFGKFYSIYELLSIESFDTLTIKKLLPFIAIKPERQASLRNGLKDPDIHDLFLRSQTVFET